MLQSIRTTEISDVGTHQSAVRLQCTNVARLAATEYRKLPGCRFVTHNETRLLALGSSPVREIPKDEEEVVLKSARVAPHK